MNIPTSGSGGRFHFRTPTEIRRDVRTASRMDSRHARDCRSLRVHISVRQATVSRVRSARWFTLKEFLRHLVLDGLRRRYVGKRIVSDTGADVPLAQVRAQVEEELSIIAEVGYEDYFLITWDLLQDLPRARHRMDHARQRGGFAGLLLPRDFRRVSDPLRPLFPALPQQGADGSPQAARHRH